LNICVICTAGLVNNTSYCIEEKEKKVVIKQPLVCRVENFCKHIALKGLFTIAQGIALGIVLSKEMCSEGAPQQCLEVPLQDTGDYLRNPVKKSFANKIGFE